MLRRIVSAAVFASVAVLGIPPALALPDPAPCDGCWLPDLVTSWQWQLQGQIDTSLDVQMFDIDGFDSGEDLVTELHDGGAAVVCYLSAGSWEDWRPDADSFPEEVLGRTNGWPGERWLDIRKRKLLAPIMSARMDMCADKGFDAIEFDNVDGYQNRSGFPLSGADQLPYNTWLANQAHRRGLSVALKNDLGQVEELLSYFDFALNEQCFQYEECNRLRPFVNAGKAVLGVEYKLDTADFCPTAGDLGFNFMKKRLALRSWREPCP